MRVAAPWERPAAPRGCPVATSARPAAPSARPAAFVPRRRYRRSDRPPIATSASVAASLFLSLLSGSLNRHQSLMRGFMRHARASDHRDRWIPRGGRRWVLGHFGHSLDDATARIGLIERITEGELDRS